MARQPIFDGRKIREDFLSSQCTLRELAARSGASYSYISKLASKEGWFGLRQNKQRKIHQKTHLDIDVHSTPESHVSSSIKAGDSLRQLIIETIGNAGVGDVRSLKTLIDAWASWDTQMRKVHGIDDALTSAHPVVNIGILSGLPHSQCDVL